MCKTNLTEGKGGNEGLIRMIWRKRGWLTIFFVIRLIIVCVLLALSLAYLMSGYIDIFLFRYLGIVFGATLLVEIIVDWISIWKNEAYVKRIKKEIQARDAKIKENEERLEALREALELGEKRMLDLAARKQEALERVLECDARIEELEKELKKISNDE